MAARQSRVQERTVEGSSLRAEIDAGSPATVFVEDHVDGNVIRRHRHAYVQMIGVTQGLLRVTTAAALHIVPPMHALWLPPQVEHEIRVSGKAKLAAACIADAAGLRDRPMRSFPMTPLLLELLRAAGRFGTAYPGDGPEMRLIAVLLDQIPADVAARPETSELPMPVSAGLRQVAEGLLREPGNKRTLDEWGAQVGASARTLERRFRDETGLPFRAWRLQLQMREALARLSTGEPVQTVAHAVGYASASAFIKAFRASFSASPLQLAARYRDIAADPPA
jgi:AraC-like DNA-binding protein